MALTLILFKVSNIINLPKSQSEINLDQATIETPTAHLVADENTNLLSAKVIFRGIYNILIKEKRNDNKSVQKRIFSYLFDEK
jgi:hypothetical protein